MKLQNMDVYEMSEDEMLQLSGGVDPISTGIAIGVTVAIIGSAVNEIISDWEHFKDGLF